MSEWISVQDSLPAIGEYVQLFSNGVVQNINVQLNECDEGQFWHLHGILDEDIEIQDDDMWMPLPEPPK